MPNSNLSGFDALRLSARERQALLEEMNKSERGYRGPDNRSTRRHTYHDHAGITATIAHPGGSIVRVLVVCRSISDMGMGFLHGGYVHPGSRCAFRLMTLKHEPLTVTGRVVRCAFLRGRAHEVGVRFDQPIDPAAFVQTALRIHKNTEVSQDLPSLSGRVLLIEDSAPDRDLLQYHLQHLGVDLSSVEASEEALSKLTSEAYDLVLTDQWQPGMSGHDLSADLRRLGFAEPIVAITGDETNDTTQLIQQAGCEATLVKPYLFEDLVAVLQRFLISDSDLQPLESSLWADAKAHAMIRQYVGGLVEQVKALLTAVAQEDLPEAAKLCMRIKGTSGSYGYAEISEAAGALHEDIQLSAGTSQLLASARSLRLLVRRAVCACEVPAPTAVAG